MWIFKHTFKLEQPELQGYRWKEAYTQIPKLGVGWSLEKHYVMFLHVIVLLFDLLFFLCFIVLVREYSNKFLAASNAFHCFMMLLARGHKKSVCIVASLYIAKAYLLCKVHKIEAIYHPARMIVRQMNDPTWVKFLQRSSTLWTN